MITNTGLAVISGLVGNVDSQTAFTYVANGSSSTAAAATDTALLSENTLNGSARASATVDRATTSKTNDTLRLTKTWTCTAADSADGFTVRELGVFNAATSGGVMLARYVLTANKVLASGETFALTYKIKFA